jgi:ADP-heptose:LPS heptosyltransferase
MTDEPTHLLVLRPGAIGDTLLSFPVLERLRAQYAEGEIVLVGNAALLPLAAAFGVAQEVYDYEDPLWSELFSTRGPSSPRLKGLLARTRRAVCWLRDPEGVVAGNLRAAGVGEVTIAPGRPPADRPLHIVTYLEETLGLPPGIWPIELRYQLPAGPLPAPMQQPIVAIHPGSSSPTKCWPAPHFAAVIEQLWRRGYSILLLAGPADEQYLRALLAALPPQPEWGRLKVLKNVPLLEIAQTVQQCHAYLGNDSGPAHLAALLGVPTLALFGPSDLRTWHPVGLRVQVVQEQPLDRLTVKRVMDTFDSMLTRRPP